MIIYIAGYGRSGSTILDYEIGKSLGALSLGEFAMANRDYALYKDAKCSCKKNYDSCKLYKNIIELERGKNIDNWRNKILPQTNFLFRYFYFLFWLFFKRKIYNLNNISSIDKDLKIVTKLFPNSIIVDSSKSTIFSALRPYVLKRLGYKVIVIHIYRTFFQTLRSILKGDNYYLGNLTTKKKKFRIIRFILSFNIAKFNAMKLSKDFKYIQVNQSDLLDDKSKIISDIKKFINSNFKLDYTKYYEHHIVGGNRLKSKFD